MKNFILSLTILMLIGLGSKAQNTFETAKEYVIGTSITYDAPTTNVAPSGPFYYDGGSGNPNSPCWFYIIIPENGSYSIECSIPQDQIIDHTCWGPFNDYASVTTSQLTSSKVVSWGYISPDEKIEMVQLNGATKGKCYILEVDNYSQANITVTIQPEGYVPVPSDPPSITCPGDQSLNLDVNCEVTLPDYRSSATVSDPNDPIEDLSVTQTPSPGSTVSSNTTVVLEVTNTIDLTDQCSFTVTVNDITAPTIADYSPDDIYITADGSINVPDYTQLITANDACDNNLNITQNHPSGNTSDFESISSIRVTAADDAGNSTFIDLPITILDSISPSVSHPDLDDIYLDDNCAASTPDYFTSATVSDNYSTNLTKTQTPLAGTPLVLGLHQIELKVEDEAGNSSKKTLLLAVLDNTKPTMLELPYQVLYTDKDGFVDIPDYTIFTNPKDNCDDELTLIQAPPPGSFNDYDNYSQVEITAIDDSGNEANISFAISYMDTVKPTISGPDDFDFNVNNTCELILPDYTDIVEVADNFSHELRVIQSPLPGTAIALGQEEIQMKVIDGSGNYNTHHFNLNILDTVSPSMHTIVPQVSYIDENGQVELQNYCCLALTEDACDDKPIMTQIPAAGLLNDYASYPTIMVEAEDASGNISHMSFPMVYLDTIAPKFTNCPDTLSLSVISGCVGILPDYYDSIHYTDNAAEDPERDQSPEAGAELEIGYHSVTLTLTDGANNKTRCTFIVNVTDNIAPYVRDIGNVEAYINADGKAIIEDYRSMADVDDYCDDNPTVVQVPAPGLLEDYKDHKNGIVYAIDKYGNSDTATFELVYIDTIPPKFIVPPLDTLYVGDFCRTEMPDYTKIVQLEDNGSPAFFTRQLPEPTISLNGPGDIKVHMDAADEAGNYDSISFIVAVRDTTAPYLDQIATQDVYYNSDGHIDLPNFVPMANIYDPCDASVEIKQTPPPGILEDLQLVDMVKIVARDKYNNADSISFMINLVDDIPPVITCLEDQSIKVDENCEANIPDFTTKVTATDNLSVITSISQEPLAGTMVSYGNLEIKMTAIDEAGNAASCTFMLQVTDTIKPEITQIAEQTIYFNEAGKIIVPNYTSEAKITDQCDDNPIIVQIPTAGELSNFMDYSFIKIKATDAAMNSDSIQFMVTFTDTIKPQLSCPEPEPLYKDETCHISLPDYTTAASVSDNVDTDITLVQDPPPGTLLVEDMLEVKISATDSYMNTSVCSLTVMALDTIHPKITECPDFIDLYTDDNCTAKLPDLKDQLIVNDNCNPILTYEQDPQAGIFLGIGVYPVEISISDDSGNTSRCSFMVHVSDTTAPVFTQMMANQVIPNEEGECHAVLPDYNSYFLAEDNCSSEVSFIQSPEANSIISGDNNEVQMMALDEYGNTAIYTFNVTAKDITPPEILCPQDEILEPVQEECLATVEDYTNILYYSDDCDPEPLVTQSPPPGTTFSDEIEVFFYITDASGNQATCSTIVKGKDDIPPTFEAYSDITSCDPYIEYESPIATDNCYIEEIIKVEGLDSGSEFPIGLTQMKFKATDAAGNISFLEFEVEILPTPSVELSNYEDPNFCDDGEAVPLPEAIPIGGIYEGPGVDGTYFHPIIAGIGTHTITYTYTNEEGCSEQDQIEVYVSICTGVHSTNNERLTVFPNPFDDKIQLQMVHSTMDQIMVLDYSGKSVMMKDIEHQNYSLDMHELPAGIYFIHILCTDGNHYLQKVMKH